MSQLGTLTMRPVKLPSFGAKRVSITCYDESNLARLMAEDAKRAGIKARMPEAPKKPAFRSTGPNYLERRSMKIAQDREAVLAALEADPRRISVIAARAGVSESTAGYHLRSFVTEGLAKKVTGQKNQTGFALIGGDA